MNPKHFRFARLGMRTLLAIAMVAPLAQCSSDPEKTVHWEEEVALSNGVTVVINRTQIYRRVGEPGQGSGWLFDRASLVAKLPGNDDVQWSGQLQPLVLDFGPDKQTYMLLTVQTYRGRSEYEVPQGIDHVAFKKSEMGWVRIPLEDFPTTLKPNLLASTYLLFIDKNEPSGTRVTILAKRQLDSRATLGEPYKGLKLQRQTVQ